MSILVIDFPNFDPVALELGPLAIKWYGLAYMAGLLLGWLYIRRLLSQPTLWPSDKAPFTAAAADDLLIYVTIGVILGGRLGYVLFYEPGNYYNNPLDIFKIWQGGMAFHGALIASGLAIWAFSKRHGANVWSTMDLAAAAVPIGLTFGRLANFINGELFGRPSDVPWAMVFPNAKYLHPDVEPVARHPSQLYEAALEGVVLFIIIRVMTHHFLALKRPGVTIGAFLIGYGCARSFCELFRQFDPDHALSTYGLTPGIVYSIPMILLGAWFVQRAQRRNSAIV